MKTLFEKLSTREKIIAIITGVIVLSFSGYYGLWAPIQSKYEQVGDEIFTMKLKIRKAEKFVNHLEIITEESKKYSNLEYLEADSDEEAIARFLNFTEETARRTHVSLEDIRPEPVQSDKALKQYRIKLSVDSTMSALIEFIYNLRNSPQRIEIERIELNAPKKDSTTVKAFMIIRQVMIR